MPDDPSLENISQEAAILKELHYILQDARLIDHFGWAEFLEKRARPRLRLAFLDIEIKEAKRCQAYKTLGSPRVIELEAARNKLAFEVAKLDAEKGKR